MKLSATLSLMRLALTLSSLSVSFSSAQASEQEIQAAYHVIYSYPGLEPPQSLLDLTQQGLVGGIILFGENIGNSTPAIIDKFQSAYAQSPCYDGDPLLIMTDQEGGLVRRLPGGPDLSELHIGSSSDYSAAATTAGSQAAAALSAYNCNTNLAPVLGVYRSPGDFLDQYQRSYSNDSCVVSTCGAAFITAQQSAGAIATAKHFPGLGAALANQDTDYSPVTINLTLSELQSVDEAPYVEAISAGVKMVMASWAYYPALDPDYPSGLSSAWIQGQLRQRLGFTGVTITDAIEAGGLEAFGLDDGYRAVLASLAGMDLILAAALNATQGLAIAQSLNTALSNGTLDSDTFAAATQRIKDLRTSLAS